MMGVQQLAIWDIFHNNKILSTINVIIVGNQIAYQGVEVSIWVLFDKVIFSFWIIISEFENWVIFKMLAILKDFEDFKHRFF